MSKAESPALRYWLLAGIALHVALGLVIDAARGVAVPVVVARRTTSTIDLYLQDAASTAPTSDALARDTHAGDERTGDALPPLAHDEPAKPARRVTGHAPGPAAAARLASSTRLEHDGTAAPGSERGSAPPESLAPSVEPDATVTPRSPSLSLDALGVGTFNPFVGDELAAPERARDGAGATAAALSGRRVEQSIETALAKRDQRIGLGPEGPVVKEVEQLVMQGSTAPDGDATLFVRTDADGKVIYVEVREASADGPEWERIARELVRALGDQRMRAPAGSRGVSFQVRVTSREQLPSGASPGLEINVLGMTLKHGRGERPTKISILEPHIGTMKVPIPNDPAGREVEALVISLVPFALFGDPVDIGAPARRVVRAHLTDLTVH